MNSENDDLDKESYFDLWGFEEIVQILLKDEYILTMFKQRWSNPEHKFSSFEQKLIELFIKSKERL